MEGSMWRLTQGIFSLNICPASFNISRREISTKLLFEKLGLPEKPKKPSSPFFKFTNNSRKALTKQNPNMTQRAVAAEASRLWKILNETEKQKYIDEFKEEYKIYRDKLQKYEKSLTKEQQEEIKAAEKDIELFKQRKYLRLLKTKKERDLNKPKPPLTPFFQFLKSENKDNSGLYQDYVKSMAQKWENLSSKEKEMYKEMFVKEFVEYKKQLLTWEEEMIKLGHLDMVRSSTLKTHLKVV